MISFLSIPKVLLSKAAFHLVISQHVLVHGLTYSLMQENQLMTKTTWAARREQESTDTFQLVF